MRLGGGGAYLIFVELLAIDDLGALDDVFRRDIWVLGDGLQGEAVVLPCREVVGAVDGDAAALDLVFRLVLAKPPELALLIDGDAAGVGVYEIAVGVVPSPAGHDVLGVGQAEQEVGEPHGRGWDWRFGMLLSHVIYCAGGLYPERRTRSLAAVYPHGVCGVEGIDRRGNDAKV